MKFLPIKYIASRLQVISISGGKQKNTWGLAFRKASNSETNNQYKQQTPKLNPTHLRKIQSGTVILCNSLNMRDYNKNLHLSISKEGKKRQILIVHTEFLWKLNVLPAFGMFSGREVQSGIALADLIWEAFVLSVCTPLHTHHTLTSKRNKPSSYEIHTTTLEAAYGMQSSMTSCKWARDAREPLVTSLRLPASSAGLLWCWRRASGTSAKRLPKSSSSALLVS